jgi:hypothetical protein
MSKGMMPQLPPLLITYPLYPDPLCTRGDISVASVATRVTIPAHVAARESAVRSAARATRKPCVLSLDTSSNEQHRTVCIFCFFSKTHVNTANNVIIFRDA